MSTPCRTVYNLAKYSRATPRESQNGRGLELDWQHHTEPVLRLLLEICRTPAGVMESARMRIVWTGTSTAGGSTAQENTVLEDVDFVLLQKQNAHLTTQGLVPLKAVYRESMLGIRYFQRTSNTLPQVQRRFQITFFSADNTAEVISAIKDVCAVKQSGSSVQYPHVETQFDNTSVLHLPPPSTAAIRLSGDGLATSSSSTRQYSLQNTAGPSRPPVSFSNTSSFTAIVPSMGAMATRSDSIITNNLALQGVVSTTQLRNNSVVGQISAPPIIVLPDPRSSQQTRNDMFDLEDPQAVSIHSGAPMRPPPPPPLPSPPPILPQQTSSDDTLPPSSAMPSSDADPSMTTAIPLDVGALSSAFEGLTSAKMSSQQLETLVAQIIHEEGFAQLLEDIDNLWRLKALFP